MLRFRATLPRLKLRLSGCLCIQFVRVLCDYFYHPPTQLICCGHARVYLGQSTCCAWLAVARFAGSFNSCWLYACRPRTPNRGATLGASRTPRACACARACAEAAVQLSQLSQRLSQRLSQQIGAPRRGGSVGREGLSSGRSPLSSVADGAGAPAHHSAEQPYRPLRGGVN